MGAQKKKVQFIRKRDGRIVPFDLEKIVDAIFNAARAVGGDNRDIAQGVAQSVRDIVEIAYCNERIPTVENIQDLVEKMLIEKGHAKVAKAYILYREQHRKIRDGKDLLNEGIALIEKYLDRSDWRVNENSNMSYSLQGLNNHIASAVTAKYWLERIYPPEIRDAHINCDVHLHDLGLLSAYCVGWDLKVLLRRGFGGVPGKVESRPAKHFRSALGQVVNFFYTLQGE
nr:anaerobic ribonucleoside-triphosphate reductase [Spirochaetota bacterium]